jgi:hypothetical protein
MAGSTSTITTALAAGSARRKPKCRFTGSGLAVMR